MEKQLDDLARQYPDNVFRHPFDTTFVKMLYASQFEQQIRQSLFPALSTTTQELRYQRVSVAIHHQPGQPI